jgi:hypothetical protein
MTTRFEIARCAGQIPGSTLVYRPEEYSFDMVPAPRRNFTSVLVDDLSLEVDVSGKVISVWGMCPHTRWTEAALVPPMAEVGALFAISDRPFLPGVSVQVNPNKYLPTYVDRTSGWVQVKGESTPAASVRPFPGVIVEIGEQGQFCSLWLKPQQGIKP